MLHEYHVIYSVRYYPGFHITVVDLGTHYPWIWGHYCKWLSYKTFSLAINYFNRNSKSSGHTLF